MLCPGPLPHCRDVPRLRRLPEGGYSAWAKRPVSHLSVSASAPDEADRQIARRASAACCLVANAAVEGGLAVHARLGLAHAFEPKQASLLGLLSARNAGHRQHDGRLGPARPSRRGSSRPCTGPARKPAPVAGSHWHRTEFGSRPMSTTIILGRWPALWVNDIADLPLRPRLIELRPALRPRWLDPCDEVVGQAPFLLRRRPCHRTGSRETGPSNHWTVTIGPS